MCGVFIDVEAVADGGDLDLHPWIMLYKNYVLC
jgi:hypothetical protein